MFGFLKKDPVKKLNEQYNKLLSDAMQAQRSGDIRLYSDLTKQAEDLLKEIDAANSAKS